MTRHEIPKDLPEWVRALHRKDKLRDRTRLRGWRKGFNRMAITDIYNEGFPLTTPFDEAMQTALTHAREQGIEGELVKKERIQTDEHTAAGEYLVRLYFSNDDDPDDTVRPPKG